MTSKINIDNYEAFLLDYMEGNLGKEDLIELQIFAARHPELNIDLNDLEFVELVTDEVTFENKENLKKTGISDEKFVAYIENELSEEEKKKIDALCAKDEKSAKDLKLFKHTLLAADTTIVFEHKKKLKKQETKVLWLFSREVLSVAASLTLIMGLWFMFRNFMPGNEVLNSQKIGGPGKINSIASYKTGAVSTFTLDKVKRNDVLNNSSSNPVAYSNKKINSTDPKETKELTANNTLTQNVNNDSGNIPGDNVIKKEENTIEKESVKIASAVDKDTKENKAKASNPYVIIEKAYDEDEKQLASNEKNGFWKKAMKALNGLNKLGVKNVGGTETTQSNNDQTLLSMGNLSIENKRYNAE